MFGFNKKQNTESILENNLLLGKDFLNKLSQTEKAILIDVRTPEEFNHGHIEKAVNIDITDLDFINKIQKLDKSSTYFIYCLSGSRSGGAVRLIKNLGVDKIYDLQGGLISNSNIINLVS